MQNIMMVVMSYLGIFLYLGTNLVAKMHGDCDDERHTLTKHLTAILTALICLILPFVALQKSGALTPGGWNAATSMTAIGVVAPILFFSMNAIFGITDLIYFFKNKN